MKKGLRVPLLCGTILSLGATGAVAQVETEPAADGAAAGVLQLEEIIVTARRRAESLQSVPVSVSAISASELQNNIATDLTKIAELAPQVIIGRQTIGTGAVIGIRGISSTSGDPGLDQSVAVAIDNVVLSRGRIISMATFDLAQVEVLEGPQALFFGKNSPAGVVSMRSADPTSRVEGYVRGGYEFVADERYVEGAISGPLSDTLKARLAVRGSSMEGWVRNVAGPMADPLHPGVVVPGANNGKRQPGGDDFAGRLTLVWNPSDDFDATLKVTGTRQVLNAMNAYAESFCANGQTVPTALGTIPLATADCKKDQVKSESGLAPDYAGNYPYGNNGVPKYVSNGYLTSLTMNKQFDAMTLTSTTGYYSQNFHGTNNADYTPLALLWSAQFEEYDLVTQELRLSSDLDGPINFAGGAYYEHAWRKFGNFPDIMHAGPNRAAGNYTTFETLSDATTETLSFFGQLRWAITPTLEMAGGARYSHDRKSQDAWNKSVGTTTLALRPAGSVLASRFKDNNVSPEVTLSWKPVDRQLVYAAYKTGYKAGAISNGALLMASATADNLVIDSEKADGFEVGYKGDILDNRLRLNVTAYHYDFDDLQLGTFNSTTTSFTIQNAAAARTKGIQASVNWLATDRLTLSGNVGYNRARYLNFRDAQCYPGQTAAQGCVGGRQDLSGAQLVRAPDLTYNLGADYAVPLSSAWQADLSVDASYSADYQSAADNAPGGIQDNFWRLNAAVHVGPTDGNFRFSLIGRNLTDSYYLVSTSGRPVGGPNEFIGIFNRPREVVLQAEYRF